MKANDVLAREHTQRLHTADRQVPVGVRGVQQPKECAFRDGRREIRELTESIEPELANTLEVSAMHGRRHQHLGQQRCPTRRKPRQRRQREQRRIRTDLDVILGANPRQGVRHVDGGERTRAFVDHVGGQRSEPFASRRIGAKAAIDLHDEGDQRHPRMLHRPYLQAVGKRVVDYFRKAKLRIRTWCGKPRAIDARYRHETDTGSEPGSANAAWPRGTMLSRTRRSKARYLRAVAPTDFAVACR